MSASRRDGDGCRDGTEVEVIHLLGAQVLPWSGDCLDRFKVWDEVTFDCCLS